MSPTNPPLLSSAAQYVAHWAAFNLVRLADVPSDMNFGSAGGPAWYPESLLGGHSIFIADIRTNIYPHVDTEIHRQIITAELDKYERLLAPAIEARESASQKRVLQSQREFLSRVVSNENPEVAALTSAITALDKFTRPNHLLAQLAQIHGRELVYFDEKVRQELGFEIT